MSRLTLLSLAFVLALVLTSESTASAAGTASKGLKGGDPLGAFVVTKIAGAEDDNVEPGEQLCYRCRYGTRPMAIVFARDTRGRFQDLVAKISDVVEAQQEAQFKGLVTLLGEDASALKDSAVEVAEKLTLKNLPVVVAKENESGPESYLIPPKAALTVVLGNDSKVVSVHSFDATDDIDVDSLMAKIEAIAKLGL